MLSSRSVLLDLIRFYWSATGFAPATLWTYSLQAAFEDIGHILKGRQVLVRGAGGQQVHVRTLCSISDQTVWMKAFPCLMDFIRGSFHGSGQQPTQEGHERTQEGDRRTPDTGPPKDGTETGRSNTWGPHQRTATNNHTDPERVYVFIDESSPSGL